jgi:hypothetical protein
MVGLGDKDISDCLGGVKGFVKEERFLDRLLFTGTITSSSL